MKGFLLLPILLLGGCATVDRSREPTREWLSGTWLLIEPDLEFPAACDSGLPITYLQDGRYEMEGEAGIWRLEGDRLIETATGPIDNPEIRTGVPHVSRIVRARPDEIRKKFADGGTEILRRCPTR